MEKSLLEMTKELIASIKLKEANLISLAKKKLEDLKEEIKECHSLLASEGLADDDRYDDIDMSEKEDISLLSFDIGDISKLRGKESLLNSLSCNEIKKRNRLIQDLKSFLEIEE